MSVVHRITDSDYSFGANKLFSLRIIFLRLIYYYVIPCGKNIVINTINLGSVRNKRRSFVNNIPIGTRIRTFIVLAYNNILYTRSFEW